MVQRMKQLSEYINEKLVLNKDTFKNGYKYFPKTREELQDIIKQLLKERKDNKVIDLNDIDTSKITDMSQLFFDDHNIYKIDISRWNVSNVINMSYIFGVCGNLESIGDISKWDVSDVEDMRCMFASCVKLKSIGDISNWNVSSIINMRSMFSNCYELKSIGDISNWKTSKVEDMSYMFYNCKNLKTIGNISNWNISNVTNMADMFTDSAITNIPAWYKK